MAEMDYAHMKPREIRKLFREGKLVRGTSGMALGYVQAGLVVLPKGLALEFLIFCERNRQACPIIDVTEPGSPEPKMTAPGADVRTDLPKYRVFRDGGLVDEVTDIRHYWAEDSVAFILGGAISFEGALLRAGIPLRHLDAGRHHSQYMTNIPCVPAGRFRGPLVVSLLPIPSEKVSRAVQVSSRFPMAHGAPVHIGEPERIGIRDLAKPDFGDPPHFKPGDIPVFWACTVTPQTVALESKPPLLITQAPDHVFITDLPAEELAVI